MHYRSGNVIVNPRPSGFNFIWSLHVLAFRCNEDRCKHILMIPILFCETLAPVVIFCCVGDRVVVNHQEPYLRQGCSCQFIFWSMLMTGPCCSNQQLKANSNQCEICHNNLISTIYTQSETYSNYIHLELTRCFMLCYF